MFELDELAVCAGEGLDDETADLVPTFRSLAAVLRAFGDSLAAGEHQFADGRDLPFMRLARTYRHVIPFFFPLLDAVNRAHRAGVSTD